MRAVSLGLDMAEIAPAGSAEAAPLAVPAADFPVDTADIQIRPAVQQGRGTAVGTPPAAGGFGALKCTANTARGIFSSEFCLGCRWASALL